MIVDEELLSIMGMVSICFIFSAIVLALGISVYQRLLPSPRYDFFVCHHKVDASAQSRLLKCMMTARNLEVFIDSDDLQDLDSLFDTVRSRVRHVIVYLTKDTLTRPWCSGEIVTAYRNNKKTTVVLTDGPTGFTFLTDEEMNHLDSYIEGGKVLTKYLISMADVKIAYQWLLSDQVPLVRLPDAVRGRQRFEKLVKLLLHGSAGVSDPPQPPKNDYVLVSTDPQDNEATAAASILCLSIEQELLGFTQSGTLMCVDQEDPDIGKLVEHARAVVVLLSACTMESLPQLTAIVSCMISKTVPVIPVTTPSFQFPGGEFL